MALIDPSPFWWRVTQETFLWNYFEIGLLVQEEMSLKVFTFIAQAATMFRGAKRLLQFWQRVTQGTFCFQIILKSGYWSRRRCHLKVFYLYLWRPFCSGERNDFCNFGRGLPKKHFYVIILKLGHWSRRRFHLKVYSIFSSGNHFHQWSETILAVLVEGHPRNISVKFFEISLLV